MVIVSFWKNNICTKTAKWIIELEKEIWITNLKRYFTILNINPISTNCTLVRYHVIIIKQIIFSFHIFLSPPNNFSFPRELWSILPRSTWSTLSWCKKWSCICLMMKKRWWNKSPMRWSRFLTTRWWCTWCWSWTRSSIEL